MSRKRGKVPNYPETPVEDELSYKDPETGECLGVPCVPNKDSLTAVCIHCGFPIH